MDRKDIDQDVDNKQNIKFRMILSVILKIRLLI